MKKVSRIDSSHLKDMGNAAKVQRHQLSSAEQQMLQMKNTAAAISEINDYNLDSLDALIAEAEALAANDGIMTDSFTESEYEYGAQLAGFDEISVERTNTITLTEVVDFNENTSWEAYLHNVNVYAKSNNIDLTTDPFITTMSQNQITAIQERVKKDYYERTPQCDKFDYLIATFCGVVSGLIDSFFVGIPKQSVLGNWTDEQSRKFILNASHVIRTCEHGSVKYSTTYSSAVHFLETQFPINYDMTSVPKGIAPDFKFSLGSTNHHLKSLAHCPDIFGLIFSIIDQFTNETTFVDNGRLIRIVPDNVNSNFRLEGANIVAKVFSAVSNWFGHLLSDFVGSSSTVKDGGRGSGIPIPFYEMFSFCNFGNLDGNTIAEMSVKIFENGYDLRFGITQSIPVAINELLIRMLYTFKYHFYNKIPMNELLKLKAEPELNRMLLVGHSALCLVDTADAAVRSGCSNWLDFILRLNGAAWLRLSFACLAEIKSIYHRNHIDVKKLDKELEDNWKELCTEMLENK
ncbi:MAG: hypothetical protein J6K17_09315 [Oscillospiraceae bacterium]|nr:hypothetical protein [Oscillospiraceae bacterium]